MNFRFDTAKATEVACLFLEKAGGQLNIMKLVKLVYLLDRLSLDRRGMPVVGGAYFSLPNGPITSELLDLINAGCLRDNPDRSWEECISDRQDHNVQLKRMPPRERVSDAEVELIEQIWAEHGGKNQWQLAEWCHHNCPEWTRVESSRVPITVEGIAEALRKGPEAIKRLQQEAAELNRLSEIFGEA